MENQDVGSRIEDRGSRIESRVKKKHNKFMRLRALPKATLKKKIQMVLLKILEIEESIKI